MYKQEIHPPAPSQANIIAEIIKGCGYKNYLELGIRYGETYNYIKQFVERAVGVDIKYVDFIPSCDFFNMTTDAFFEQNSLTFDAIFIDACHEFEQVKKDFHNAVKCLNKLGTIFLHDTDPFIKQYLGNTYCQDSYKMNEYLQSLEQFQFVTIPSDVSGLSIVRNKDDNRFNYYL